MLYDEISYAAFCLNPPLYFKMYRKSSAYFQFAVAANRSAHQFGIFGYNVQAESGTLYIGSIGTPKKPFH